jgi:hypothetical protein
VEHFNYLTSIVTDNARCAPEIRSKIAMVKAAFNQEKELQKEG